MPRSLAFVLCSAVALFSVRPAHAVSVGGGECIINFNAAQLAALNMGSNPEIGALILEEFFGGDADRLRDRTQIVTEHIVPGITEIPATGLKFEVNGPSVVNLTKRYSQPTTFQYSPADLAGTPTGKIGLRGVLRFVGDFDGIFTMGDFEFKWDATRVNAGTGRSGWVFFNRFDNFQVNAWETKDVTTTISGTTLTITGTLIVSDQLANAFLNGDNGKPVGNFTLRATTPGSEVLPVAMTPVGNAGNTADPATGYGAVSYDYHMSQTEVTNTQYATFLNSVDPDGTNTYALYNSNMSESSPVIRGGIDFTSGAAAGTKYQAKALFANKPVNYISFYDAARFTNWLTTGDTESGFYKLSGLTIISSEGPYGTGFGRSYYSLPSEDEWYKAAYHKNNGTAGDYFLYATSSDTTPTKATSTPIGDVANPGRNVANYDFGATWNDTEGLGIMVTVGGAGPGSASPYGTYDQTGNQWEWCGTFVGANRVMRGGSLWSPLESQKATHRADYFPETGGASLGFRVSGVLQNGPVAQGISFAALPDLIWNPSGNSFTVSATATSGESVSFSITEGPATIVGNTVTVTGFGTVTVTATQAGGTGSPVYAPAPPVNRTFAVTKIPQTIDFAPLINRRTNEAAFTLSATATSGLPVSFQIVSGPASIVGTTLTLTGGEGTVVARASQPGDATRSAAPNVDRSFVVTRIGLDYFERDFGTLSPSGTTTSTLNNTVNGNAAWADGTDADFGDSQLLRPFRFTLASASYVTIHFESSTNGGSASAGLNPGFSVYAGLAHLPPAEADRDLSTVSLAWRAAQPGAPKEGCFNALGDWKIGSDAGTTMTHLSSFSYVGHAADSAQGDGTADGSVTGTFYLLPGSYTIMLGGASQTASSGTIYGVNGTVSVSAANPAGLVTFSAPTYVTAFGSLSVNVTINRYAGGAACSIDLSATSGSALAGADFTNPAQSVSFAANETSKTIAIALLPQTGLPVTKSFTLALANPTNGAALGGQPSATVSLVPMDTTRPVVSITAPKLNAVINSPAAVIATGTASDNKALSKVQLSLNDAAFVDASLTGSTWSRTLTPVAGLNTLLARSVDAAGNVSAIAFTQFSYVVKTALIATSADTTKGTITGLLAGNVYQIGTTYTLTAVAKAGFYFDHWSANQGDLFNANQPKVSFVMSQGLRLTAWFIPNPYLSAAGSYNGLIRANSTATTANTGFISLSITSAGNVGTGSLKVDGATLPIGVVSFTSAGEALFGTAKTSTLLLKRTGKPDLALTLNVETSPAIPGANKLTGTLTSTTTGDASTINADRAYYNGTTLKPTALLNKPTSGYYTLFFPASAAPNNGYTAAQFPQGDGTAMITLTSAGVATLVNTLADGTAFTSSAPLSQANKLPVFAALYTSKGSFSGELAFDTAPADSDITGTAFHWFRPTETKAQPVYTAGWPNGITINAVGAKYDATKNFATSLGLSGNGKLEFTDGKLTTTITKTNFTLSVTNVVVKTDATYTLVPKQSTGEFSGTFTHNNQTAKPTYKGLLLQKGANAGGYGWFLSAPTNGESGGVSLGR